MWQIWFFLVLTVIFWGTTPIIEKSGLKNTDVFTALFIRSVAVFFAVLVSFSLSGRMSSLSKVAPKTWLLFSVSGLLAGLLGMLTYFKVLQISPSSKIVPLTATYPLVTAILSFLILKEDFSWQKVVGTILIVSGILLVK